MNSVFSNWELWVVGLAVSAIFILSYNYLISKKNALEQARSVMDVYLKQRFDLVPNLVSSVRAYMDHERGLLERIAQVRSSLAGGPSDGDRFRLEGELSVLLGRLIAVAENYPQLRASDNFLHLQQSLFEIEDRISAARRAYNVAVTEYNNALEMIPTNFMATLMGLKKAEWFEIPEEERKVPQVAEFFK